MSKFFSPGDHLVICDVSGQKALRSECVRRWDGLIVKREFAEPRHPLDHERPPPIERGIIDARPPGDPVYLNDGDVTAEDL